MEEEVFSSRKSEDVAEAEDRTVPIPWLLQVLKQDSSVGTGVCGYHADVSVYVEDAFIGALLVEFGQDQLLHPEHNTVLTANGDRCATSTHRQTDR